MEGHFRAVAYSVAGGIVLATAAFGCLGVPPWLGYGAVGLIAGLVLALVLPGVGREWRSLDRAAAGHCLACNYDLRGQPHAGRCPECGTPFGVADWGVGDRTIPLFPADLGSPTIDPSATGPSAPMRANVEIKARVHDLARLAQTAAELSGTPPTLLHQVDTFFPVPTGRLKLRQLAPDRGELIYYHRPDQPGPKQSDYAIVPTTEPTALAALLSQALGVAGVVRKDRRLYLVGPTRIHVDRVERLGDFVELEVVLRPGLSPDEGQAIAEDLMHRLGIRPDDLVSGAYLDLLRDPSRR